MSRNGAPLQKDVPRRAYSGRPTAKIHHNPFLRVSQTSFSNYAILVMKHPDPIGSGLGTGVVVEAAEWIVLRLVKSRLLNCSVSRSGELMSI